MDRFPFRHMLLSALESEHLNKAELARRSGIGLGSILQYLDEERPVLPALDRIDGLARAIGESPEALHRAWLEQRAIRDGVKPARVMHDHHDEPPISDEETEILRAFRKHGPLGAATMLLEIAKRKAAPAPERKRERDPERKRSAAVPAMALA